MEPVWGLNFNIAFNIRVITIDLHWVGIGGWASRGTVKNKKFLEEMPNFKDKNLKTPVRTIQNPHPAKPLSSSSGLRNMTVKRNLSAPPVHCKV